MSVPKKITINGTNLTMEQAEAVRVAIEAASHDMNLTADERDTYQEVATLIAKSMRGP